MSGAEAQPAATPAGASVFLRVDDLVRMLEVKRTVIDRACREYRISRGRTGLPHCKLGRGFLFRRSAVEEWVRSMEQANHA
jgi:predicted DNA-binding transcriptional regulator AlpA